MFHAKKDIYALSHIQFLRSCLLSVIEEGMVRI